jgi:hypothetical protein
VEIRGTRPTESSGNGNLTEEPANDQQSIFRRKSKFTAHISIYSETRNSLRVSARGFVAESQPKASAFLSAWDGLVCLRCSRLSWQWIFRELIARDLDRYAILCASWMSAFEVPSSSRNGTLSGSINEPVIFLLFLCYLSLRKIMEAGHCRGESGVPWIHEHLTVESSANFRDWGIRYHSRS